VRHQRLAKADLLVVLRDMAERVEADDSFEGSVEWTCIDPETVSDDLEPGEFMVRAFWRVGNSEGQGGARIVGTVEESADDSSVRPDTE